MNSKSQMKRIKAQMECKLTREEMLKSIQKTHHDECWRDPDHHVCAVAKIETLLLKIDLYEAYEYERSRADE